MYMNSLICCSSDNVYKCHLLAEISNFTSPFYFFFIYFLFFLPRHFCAIFVLFIQSFRLISLSVFPFSSFLLFVYSFLLCIPLQCLYPLFFLYTAKFSNIKMQVWLPVVSNDDCNRVYTQKRISIGDSQLCAGGVEGKDSCTGDSGGPLMSTGITPRDGKTRYFVAGVVSYGPETCGTRGWPGVYTRVSGYTDWILNQLAE